MPLLAGAILLAWGTFAVANPDAAISRPRYEVLLFAIGATLVGAGLKWAWERALSERTAMPTGPDA